MLLKEPVSLDLQLLGLKQKSVSRTLATATEALANGTLRTFERPANFSYEQKLRVPST